MKKLHILLLVSCTYMAPMYCYKHARHEIIYPTPNVALIKSVYTAESSFYRKALYQKIVYDDASQKTYNHKVYAMVSLSGFHEGSTYKKRDASRSVEKIYVRGPENLDCTDDEARNLFADLANEFDRTTKTKDKQVIVEEW